MSLPTMGCRGAAADTGASLWDYDAEAVGNTRLFGHNVRTCQLARGDLVLARANSELFASLNKQESEPPSE